MQHVQREFLRQVPRECRQNLTGPIKVTIAAYYASNRFHLNVERVYRLLEAPHMDHLGVGIIMHRRQVVEKHVRKFIDKANPRLEIQVEAVQWDRKGIAVKPQVEDLGKGWFKVQIV